MQRASGATAWHDLCQLESGRKYGVKAKVYVGRGRDKPGFSQKGQKFPYMNVAICCC